MRSYRKVKELPSNTTASLNNKGLLVINSDTEVSFYANIVNYDNTLTGVTFTCLGVNVPTTPAARGTKPNYNLIPFTVKKWIDSTGSGTLKAYELF